MKALSANTPDIYLLKHQNNKMFAYKGSSPMRLFGFRRREDAVIVRKNINIDSNVCEITKRVYTVDKAPQSKTHSSDINIIARGIVDTCVKSHMNNIDFIIVDTVVEKKTKILIFEAEKISMHIDILLIKSNLEKIIQQD